MHILVTGAAGFIGSNVMLSLLTDDHLVTATDIVPFPAVLGERLSPYLDSNRVSMVVGDLTDVAFVDSLFNSASAVAPVDGIIHIGGIPTPHHAEARRLHNINVTSTYNVLETGARLGIKRMVQASSCNALGLSYTMPEHWALDFVPVNESHPSRPEDAYSLSKLVVEEQAKSLCRLYPSTRVASIRIHYTPPPNSSAPAKVPGLWSWSSVDAIIRACVLGLTSDGWTGAEAFHISSGDIWAPEGKTALELLETHWPGRVKQTDRTWWKDNPRRSFFDTSKAERMLGWRHDL